ncbi:MAG TPA: MinD/ParA family protein [Candidatus Woesearchaeota archaeon]|mgnify:CR=1 FL=1|nr:MinD/ParA family protein [Candidatus Woesearchaeota archaeon]
MAKIISVVSFKGGSGKSFFSLNLASALALQGKETLLVDLNFSSPSLHNLLGVSSPESTLTHFVKGFETAESIVFMHPSGMKVVFGDPAFGFTLVNSIHRIKKLLLNLFNKFDFIILDTAPSFSEGAKPAFSLSEFSIGVSLPFMYSLEPTLKCLNLLKGQGSKVLGFVFNQCRRHSSELTSRSVPAFSSFPLLASIGYDEEVYTSEKKHHPLVYINKKSEVSITLSGLASTLSGRTLR